jgi:BMFP domain-containing protein YqiC
VDKAGFHGRLPIAIALLLLLATASHWRHIPAMQTDNPLLDGLAKFFTDAAGAANSVRNEIDSFVRQRLEKLVADMDFVPREEFEAVKAMAAKAREENERLAARVAELERNASGTIAAPSPHIGPV